MMVRLLEMGLVQALLEIQIQGTGTVPHVHTLHNVCALYPSLVMCHEVVSLHRTGMRPSRIVNISRVD